ncbi:hypothetical protein BJ508DRAFT_372850 [Ascobolus immersus RN42]|uniref:Uncharacterized protein n=1 Tax=Ascobolus immersus RN42 TaxID=1160509 RepID=A0A3N4IQV7_ASCIM|nr:hypothetical protein BJ508DRAFT_372850 [Ascobolus immersus RN42]
MPNPSILKTLRVAAAYSFGSWESSSILCTSLVVLETKVPLTKIKSKKSPSPYTREKWLPPSSKSTSWGSKWADLDSDFNWVQTLRDFVKYYVVTLIYPEASERTETYGGYRFDQHIDEDQTLGPLVSALEAGCGITKSFFQLLLALRIVAAVDDSKGAVIATDGDDPMTEEVIKQGVPKKCLQLNTFEKYFRISIDKVDTEEVVAVWNCIKEEAFKAVEVERQLKTREERSKARKARIEKWGNKYFGLDFAELTLLQIHESQF